MSKTYLISKMQSRQKTYLLFLEENTCASSFMFSFHRQYGKSKIIFFRVNETARNPKARKIHKTRKPRRSCKPSGASNASKAKGGVMHKGT